MSGAMFDIVVMHLVGGLVILACGVGIFFAVNKRRPTSGGRPEYGTRRSRWTGYCAISGAVAGEWIGGVLHLVMAAQHGAPAVRWGRDYFYSGSPCIAMFGFLAGLALGTFSSRFIPEKTRPPDPDNP